MKVRNAPASFVVALSVLWILTLVVTPLIGARSLDLAAVLDGASPEALILWDIRLPRVLLALVAGGVLAMAGAAFQTLFRNSLAEPYTLGVAGGAALGAVLAMPLAGRLEVPGLPLVAVASFGGALAVSLLILGLSRSARALETHTLLLAGIAISLSTSAIILFIQYLSDFTRTFRIVRWMMGGLAVVGYGEVLWVVPWAALGAVVLFLLRRDLDLLLAGEEMAASRGLDLGRVRLTVLGAVSLMVGALVAVAGPIGFVGLIVPHMLRRWAGHGHLTLVPACALGGGIFLCLCDLAARTIMAPAELPVGVVTALLGGPFFLWLLIARTRD